MLFVKEKLAATATKTSPLRWVIYSKSLVKMLVTRRCIYRCIRGFSRLSWITNLSGNAANEYEKNERACSWKLQTSSPRHFSGKSFNLRSLVRSVTERVFLIFPGKIRSTSLGNHFLTNELLLHERLLASRERTLSFVIIFLFSNTIEKRPWEGEKKLIF